MKPYDNQPAFAPFYAPGFWLAAIGLVVLLTAAPRSAARAPRRRAAPGAPAPVTLAFVVMAELYVGSGMAQQIAEALHAAAGRFAVAGRASVRRRRRLPDRRRRGRPTPW